MQQIILRQHGGPSVLTLTDAPTPVPTDTQVLIRVEAIGVNFSDVLRRRDEYFVPTPTPFVLGTEAVGTIEAVGSAAGDSGLAVGMRVLAALPGGGAYAEYVAAEAMFCIPLPPGIPSDAATAIFVQGSTAALLATVVASGLAAKPSKRVLVTAAAGGVGSLLAQRCRDLGAEVVAAVGSTEKVSFADRLGARQTITYGEPGWAAFAKTQGVAPVDILFDAVGGPVFAEALTLLKDGGKAIVYGAASRAHGGVDTETFVDRNLSLESFNLAHYIEHHPKIWQQALGDVIGRVAAGALKVRVAHRYALADAAAAHADLEARRTTGKVVLATRYFDAQ